jgi:hypothetical protein
MLSNLATFYSIRFFTFYVEVHALSKYNAHHIFAYAGKFFPPDEPMREAEVPRRIECLINELKASGIYEDVQAQMKPSSREGIRLLKVHVVYHRYIKNLAISEISPEGFPEIDIEKFRSILKEKGIRMGMRFLKYNLRELTEKMTEALREAYPKELIQKNDDRPLWFIIRPGGYGDVKIIISSALPRCEPAT